MCIVLYTHISVFIAYQYCTGFKANTLRSVIFSLRDQPKLPFDSRRHYDLEPGAHGGAGGGLQGAARVPVPEQHRQGCGGAGAARELLYRSHIHGFL